MKWEVLPAVGLVFFLTLYLGEALLCYRYEVPFINNQPNSSCIPVTALCQGTETCATYFMTAWNQYTILARSCLESYRCGNSTIRTYHNLNYSVDGVFCCNTDLCNAASVQGLSLLSAISLLLFWVVH